MGKGIRAEGVFVVSLGCAKNLVDSEHILGALETAGYRIVPDLEQAQSVIVNTCGFIQSAVEEAVDTILEMVEKKIQGTLQRVFVVGCFVQRYGYKLRREIPEVDGGAGTGDACRILKLLEAVPRDIPVFLINRPVFPAEPAGPRLISGAGFSAYLKISEGCSHRCSFCMIPLLRGGLRSRSMRSLLREAEMLADRGVKELNLVAQDTTAYGRDMKDGNRLEHLLEALLEIDGLEWIRLLYAHPFGVTDHLLQLMASEERICSYLDIPFQHISPNILEAMGRGPIQHESPKTLLKRIRSTVQGISIRTTLMVGFPGETEHDFEQLCSFVASADLDHMGAFIFSAEKGVPASRFPDRVPLDVGENRLKRLMLIQAEASLRKKTSFLGRVEPVLVEGFCRETDLLLVGRTRGMAPDVDGRVLINKGEAGVGGIVPVRFTEAHPYDIVGEVVQGGGGRS